MTLNSLFAAALLCLKPAKEGGYSTWASSYSIYNAMLEKHPELAEVMTRDYYVDRKDEIPEGEGPWYKLPVFNFHKVGTGPHVLLSSVATGSSSACLCAALVVLGILACAVLVQWLESFQCQTGGLAT